MNNILDRVRRVIAAIMRLSADRIVADVALEQLGQTDSLTLAEIATALEAEFDVRVPSDALAHVRTTADIAAVMAKLVPKT